MYGPTAFLISYGKGITRAVIADKTVEADLTPVDFVVNAVLTAAVKTACDAIGRKLVLDYETDSGVWSVGNGSGGETGQLQSSCFILTVMFIDVHTGCSSKILKDFEHVLLELHMYRQKVLELRV